MVHLFTSHSAYEIRVNGHLDRCYWSQWMDGLTVTLEENGETVLHVPTVDQAALFGLLNRIRDLGLPLLLVKRTQSE